MDVTKIIDYWPTLQDVVIMLFKHMIRHHSDHTCTAYTAVVDTTNVLVHICITVLAN
jgi:hypothetical protein